MWKIFVSMFVVIGLISYLWIHGFSYIVENHLNYSDGDLLGEFNENDKDNLL
jgi:hypothetical protein